MYGPGLFESVCEEVFCHEWNKNAVANTSQCGIKVIHEGVEQAVTHLLKIDEAEIVPLIKNGIHRIVNNL